MLVGSVKSSVMALLVSITITLFLGTIDSFENGRRRELILIGVTGAGKSTLCNELIGEHVCEVADMTLDSLTAKISRENGFLFGTTDIAVAVSDTGGLGDTNGRDELFVDQVAAHVRSLDGVHGVVYVHNACVPKLDAQSRQALEMMVNTLTNADNKEEIRPRLSVLMTQCTDGPKRHLYEQMMPPLMCRKFDLCDIPIFWFDDFVTDNSEFQIWGYIRRIFSSTKKISWRTTFAKWVRDLPTKPLTIPSESERERLKQQHRERQRSHGAISRSSSSYGCFSGSSQVVVQNHGPIAMRDLKVGSVVATNGGWTVVNTFLHWHSNETIVGIQLLHETGNITVTPDHLLFTICEDGSTKSIPAGKLNPGSLLLTANGTRKVKAVNPTTMDGYFAPLTSSGTILVNDVVASCYTDDGHYSPPHWVIQIFMKPLRMLPWWMSYVPEAGTIHPYARLLKMF